MEYACYTDSQLALAMIDYITETQKLYELICDYLRDGKKLAQLKPEIQYEYKRLKTKIRDADKYLHSHNEGSELYIGFFCPNIQEAAAYGFLVPTNAKIDGNMRSAVEEAKYRLVKNKPLEEWQELV